MIDFGIERDVEIEAPIDVVWRTITEPDQIKRWFADRVELELKPGGMGYLAFGQNKGTAIVVQTVDEPSRFSFWWNRPQDDDPTPENSVLVEFTLSVIRSRPRSPPRRRIRRGAPQLVGRRQEGLRRRPPGWVGAVFQPPRRTVSCSRPGMNHELDDELWSAIADPSSRRVPDLLVVGGEATATELAGQVPFTGGAVQSTWWYWWRSGWSAAASRVATSFSGSTTAGSTRPSGPWPTWRAGGTAASTP